jgi:hypothetical protein
MEPTYTSKQARSSLYHIIYQLLWDWVASRDRRDIAAMLTALPLQFDYYRTRGIPSDFMLRQIGKAPYAVWSEFQRQDQTSSGVVPSDGTLVHKDTSAHREEPPRSPTESGPNDQSDTHAVRQRKPSGRSAASTAKREPIDVDKWLKDATIVGLNAFEPVAEYMLGLGACKVLGLESLVPLGTEKGGYVLSGPRVGYSLRNLECQLIPSARDEIRDDPFVVELDRLEAAPHSVRSVWLPRLLHDVIVYDAHGGVEVMFKRLPGTTAEARRDVVDKYAAMGLYDEPYIGHTPIRQLLLVGYLLHRAYDLRPQLLDGDR